MMREVGERVLGETPFVLRRRVAWGECDPAGVVYTPVFSEYVVSAYWHFLEMLVGSPLQQRLQAMDVRTPVRALSFDFRQSLYPDDIFDIRAAVSAVRNSTVQLQFLFTGEGGAELLDARLTLVCVYHNERRSRPIPQPLRELIEEYAARCEQGQAAGGTER